MHGSEQPLLWAFSNGNYEPQESTAGDLAHQAALGSCKQLLASLSQRWDLFLTMAKPEVQGFLYGHFITEGDELAGIPLCPTHGPPAAGLWKTSTECGL